MTFAQMSGRLPMHEPWVPQTLLAIDQSRTIVVESSDSCWTAVHDVIFGYIVYFVKTLPRHGKRIILDSWFREAGVVDDLSKDERRIVSFVSSRENIDNLRGADPSLLVIMDFSHKPIGMRNAEEIVHLSRRRTSTKVIIVRNMSPTPMDEYLMRDWDRIGIVRGREAGWAASDSEVQKRFSDK